MQTKRPNIIIVTGKPAAGKSTLAMWLSRELQVPVVSKDPIREVLFERLGWKDHPWAQLLGRASIDLMFCFARAELTVGHSIILDNAFDPDMSSARFQALKTECRAGSIQIVCNADRKTLVQRFRDRAEAGNRHPGHGDSDVLHHLYENLKDDRPRILNINGPVIEVDTTDFETVNHDAIITEVKLFLDEG